MESLISLICPCYNSEKYIERFLDSILAQSYKKIQFILVNDGSTDTTKEIVLKYKMKLEDELYEFIFLEKKNGGAGSAVNVALKYVKGELLTWADSDDVLKPNNIYEKVKFMNENRDCGIAVCEARAIDDFTGKFIGNLLINDCNDNIFMKLIYPGVPCYPGVFVIRTKLLFEKLDNRDIYYCREVGQNWQLLLPVAFDNKCGYIRENVYDYYVRKESHSHQVDNMENIMRTYDQEKVLFQTLQFIDGNKKSKIFDELKQIFRKKRIDYTFEIGNYKIYKKYLKEATVNKDKLNIKYYLKYIILRNKFLYKLYLFTKKEG